MGPKCFMLKELIVLFCPVIGAETQLWSHHIIPKKARFTCGSAFAKRGACKRGLRKLDIGHHQLHSSYIPETWSNYDCH